MTDTVVGADRSKPRLIVISQVVSDGFVRWLRDYSVTYGPVELYTGTECDPAGASIRVRARPANWSASSHRGIYRSWDMSATASFMCNWPPAG